MAEPVIIDGTADEGGDQVLAASLPLSAVTGRPLRLARIRTARSPAGMSPTQVASIHAAGLACGAKLTGASVGSTDLTFVPAGIRPIRITEDVGGSGPIFQVLKTVALPLGMAEGPSRVGLEGGTHVPGVPSFDFLETDWLPAMEDAGLPLSLHLRRSGYLPEGGGRVVASFSGFGRPLPLERPVRANLKVIQGVAFVSQLPRLTAERMAREARLQLRRSGVAVRVDTATREALAPGGGIHLVAVTEDGVRTGFTFLGDPGRSAERVAREAVNALFAWLDTGAATTPWLADTLLPVLALAEEPSVFTTSKVTRDLLLTSEVTSRFLPARIEIDGKEGEPGEIRITP